MTATAFLRIIYSMVEIFDNKKWVWPLRIILTLLCILMIACIFSASLMDGETSSNQSSTVTEIVDGAVDVIAPDVMLGGSEEKEFEILHSFVRTTGHFAEFALLSALITWCVLSYTEKRVFLTLPIGISLFVAFTDEYIQSFVGGRAQEMKDVLTDFCGACVGFVCALVLVFIVKLIYRKISNKKNERGMIESIAVSVDEKDDA